MKKIYAISFALLMSLGWYQVFGQDLTNITDVTLTFTPAQGDAVTVSATDSDGDGSGEFVVSGPINLLESTTYTLTIVVEDMLGSRNLTDTITARGEDFLFFFGFVDSTMVSPVGDGNIDNRTDPVNYNDEDGGGLPIGLSTDWEATCAEGNVPGTFRIALKNQGDDKTASSGFETGSTEFDITWDLNILEDPEAPPCENEEEIITDVILNFVPVGGGDTLKAIAQDPDGEGPLDLQIVEPVSLDESTEYVMNIVLLNSVAGEDITEEIMEEDDEHMFFFGFTDSLFTSPAGDGNIDNRDDPVNYNDFDENQFPVGLSTNWETICREAGNATGEFRVVLKHQPGEKSASSDVNVGGTDVDLTFPATIMEDPEAPPCENEEEIITDVILNFVPVGGGDTLKAIAQDPDGEGPLDLQIIQDVELELNTEYVMNIKLLNSVAGEDITEEVMEEDDEHMFFFEWTDGVFSDPTGNGNADNRNDPVNYNDFDENQLPVGLSTNWTTTATEMTGSFRVVLKHQPGEKSASSDINVGGTDVDLTFGFNSVVTSVKEIAQGQVIRLFPNPVSDQLNVELPFTSPKEIDLMIYDSFGRVVFRQQAGGAFGVLPVNVQALPKGTYLLQTRSGTESWTQRFVKAN